MTITASSFGFVTNPLCPLGEVRGSGFTLRQGRISGTPSDGSNFLVASFSPLHSSTLAVVRFNGAQVSRKLLIPSRHLDFHRQTLKTRALACCVFHQGTVYNFIGMVRATKLPFVYPTDSTGDLCA